MEFRLLGPLEVWEDGRPLSLGGTKQRALLAILLLRANEVVSRDVLIDELWGDRPPASAAHSVEAYVSRLRKTLHADRAGEPILVTRPPGYMLRVGFEDVDLHRYERLLEEGRRALATHAPERALDKLREALSLWPPSLPYRSRSATPAPRSPTLTTTRSARSPPPTANSAEPSRCGWLPLAWRRGWAHSGSRSSTTGRSRGWILIPGRWSRRSGLEAALAGSPPAPERSGSRTASTGRCRGSTPPRTALYRSCALADDRARSPSGMGPCGWRAAAPRRCRGSTRAPEGCAGGSSWPAIRPGWRSARGRCG